ncbi:MAG: DNA methyltransferase [Candidatus Hodarchaeota archaeon]
MKKKRQSTLVPELDEVNKRRNKENKDPRSNKKESKYDPRNTLNNLTGKEWIQETTSIWYQKGLGKNHSETKYERMHPAPFSFTNVKRLILFFTKEGQTVLDPFSGVSSTLKAAALCNRNGIGIELTKKWVKISKERLKKEITPLDTDSKQTIIQGDAFERLDDLETNSIDFVVTSPPYYNILKKKADHKVREERLKNNLATDYSEDPRDLGNYKDYNEFLERLTEILVKCQRVLKLKKYMCVIVSDFRNKRDFTPFHSDIYSLLLGKSDFSLEGIIILVQGAKKLYPYGYPFAYVENIHHQYILVFQNLKRK